MAFGETAAAPHIQQARGRVLLVDDEPELRRTFKRALTRTGFEVVEAANGRLALQLLTQHDFEAVVSDVRMPDMDGLELLQRLLVVAPTVPVVLMSGSCGVVSAIELRDSGAFAFLDKPVQLDHLRGTAAAAIETHRERLRDEETNVRHSGVQRVWRRFGP